ncbi:MAG: hypothetical protein AB1725_09570 [Armatimonadota bacterium]
MVAARLRTRRPAAEAGSLLRDGCSLAKLIDFYIGNCTGDLCSMPRERYCEEWCVLKYVSCVCKVSLKAPKAGDAAVLRCLAGHPNCYAGCP